MKKLLLVLMFIGSFSWLTLKTTVLSAQELTVPDYSYGEVYGMEGTVTDQGVANPGPYGGYSTGTDERSSGVFLAHGFRWWGYPSFPLLICGDLPKFNFPGNHGVWDMSNLGCMNPPIGYMGAWGGVVADIDDQEISCLTGAKNQNGPTAQYCVPNPFGAGQICYPIPSSWGFGTSYGYLRKIFIVQSTGLLQPGDPVDIKASLTSEGITQGDGTITGTGVLFLNKPSGTPWYQWGMGREYLRWGDIEDIMGTPFMNNNMLGNLIIGLNNAGDTTATVAIGDTIIIEVAFKTKVDLDNHRGSGEAEGWAGEKPAVLFNNINYIKNDSIQFNLIFKPGSLGDKTSTLRIFTNDLDLTRTLTGTGAALTFTIEGLIDTPEGDTVTEGTIIVYEPEANDPSMWWKPLESARSYTFVDIPQGTVTLWFEPDTSQYQGYLTTYLGNKTVYSDAGFFNLNKDTSGLKITLVPVPPAPGGSSDVSGIFVEGNGKSGSTLSYQQYNGNGTPLKDVSVFLVNPDGSLLTYDVTDAAGAFDFKNIPAGHFGFQADYVGFFMNKANDSLIIDQENQKYYISAVAGNDTISIVISDLTGVHGPDAGEFIKIYPNPARDKLMIQFRGVKYPDKLLIRIRDLSGRLLKTEYISPPVGTSSFPTKINELPDGIYIISIEGKQFNHKARFMKIN